MTVDESLPRQTRQRELKLAPCVCKVSTQSPTQTINQISRLNQPVTPKTSGDASLCLTKLDNHILVFVTPSAHWDLSLCHTKLEPDPNLCHPKYALRSIPLRPGPKPRPTSCPALPEMGSTGPTAGPFGCWAGGSPCQYAASRVPLRAQSGEEPLPAPVWPQLP